MADESDQPFVIQSSSSPPSRAATNDDQSATRSSDSSTSFGDSHSSLFNDDDFNFTPNETGFIDLTTDLSPISPNIMPPSPPPQTASNRTRERSNSIPGARQNSDLRDSGERPPKRRRIERIEHPHHLFAPPVDPPSIIAHFAGRHVAIPRASNVDEVDLTKVDDDAALKKLQEDQRLRHEKNSQRLEEHQRIVEAREREKERNKLEKDGGMGVRLSGLQCVVCMEGLTNITATMCGHLYCHTCIMEALIAGENMGPDPGKGLSRCPVCRKKIVRSKDGKDLNQVIPLELKLKTKSEVARGKEKAKIS